MRRVLAGPPAGAEIARGREGALSCGASRHGTAHRNELPRPGVLSTPIVPPINAANRAEIVNPRPVPPYWRVVELSACRKGSKITPWCPCSLVLLDAQMPHIDGFTLASRIKQDPKFSKIPMIMLISAGLILPLNLETAVVKRSRG
jgi:CheY-like chemotaxis protein